jgi:hypothetical protein
MMGKPGKAKQLTNDPMLLIHFSQSLKGSHYIPDGIETVGQECVSRHYSSIVHDISAKPVYVPTRQRRQLSAELIPKIETFLGPSCLRTLYNRGEILRVLRRESISGRSIPRCRSCKIGEVHRAGEGMGHGSRTSYLPVETVVPTEILDGLLGD